MTLMLFWICQCEECAASNGCVLFVFEGLDAAFGNFETKTKTELYLERKCVGCVRNERCTVDAGMNDSCILQKLRPVCRVPLLHLTYFFFALFPSPSQCEGSCISGSKNHESFAHSRLRCQLLFQGWLGHDSWYACGAIMLLL